LQIPTEFARKREKEKKSTSSDLRSKSQIRVTGFKTKQGIRRCPFVAPG